MHRRLARDYETLTASSEAVIHITSIDNLTKRITDETTPTWRGTYQHLKGNSARSNALCGLIRTAARVGEEELAGGTIWPRRAHGRTLHDPTVARDRLSPRPIRPSATLDIVSFDTVTCLTMVGH